MIVPARGQCRFVGLVRIRLCRKRSVRKPADQATGSCKLSSGNIIISTRLRSSAIQPQISRCRWAGRVRRRMFRTLKSGCL